MTMILRNPTIQIPSYDDIPPFTQYDDVLESNNEIFTCDHFRMYEFKVRRCLRGRSHDWTDCPFAHPGEKARRRDPRKYSYSGTPCNEFKKGGCWKNDTCEYAHGVFECWLHPSRYRTQVCKDGGSCTRRICFFAHCVEELRVNPLSQLDPDPVVVSPGRVGLNVFGSSPTSTLYTSAFSPPMSPVSELGSGIRNLHLTGSGFGSPRNMSTLRPGFGSLPSTPTRNLTRPGLSAFDIWEDGVCLEEPVMERVESGKEIRAKMYAKLSRENSLAGDRVNSY